MSDQNQEILNEETKELTNEETETTTDIVEELKNDILVIKGKFKFPGSGIYGIFSVLLKSDIDSQEYYNSDVNPFVSLSIIVSYFSDIFQMDLKENWSTLETQFNDLQINGDFASSLTNNFRRCLLNAFSNNDVSFEVVSDFKKNKPHVIEQELDRVLSQAHKDRKMDIELFFEEADGKSIASIRKNRIESEVPLPNEDILNTPMTSVNPLKFSIPASPVLAPVGEGVPSNQLSPGVRILMKIDGSNTYGQQWIDNFKLYDPKTKTYLPIIGTVDQIGPVIKNSLDIIVKYQEEQYTKFNIEAGIKIKLFNPTQPEPFFDPLAHKNEDFRKRPIKTLKELLEEEGFKMMIVLGVGLLTLAFISWMVMS